jgi:UDP-3-O-[3-hydroxymyristoyl] glucosamine N-acyltransferase
MQLRGADREIVSLGTIGSRSAHRSQLLTYVTDARWLQEFAASEIAAAVVPEALAAQLPEGRSALVSCGDPEAVFYGLLADTAEAGEWDLLNGAVGEGTVVAPNTSIGASVILGRDCVIMPNAVLLANTRLGDRVVVQPNATIGSDGFEVREIAGRRRIVPHTGGVDIADDVSIGASTCVDRGLFGDFTTIGRRTQVDNLVHVAHSVRIGQDTTVVACAEISGSVSVGDGVWVGPGTTTLNGLTLGDHCFTGLGAVVVRDVPPHALVFGSPARIGGWLCSCATKLTMSADGSTVCAACGREWRLVDDRLRTA